MKLTKKDLEYLEKLVINDIDKNQIADKKRVYNKIFMLIQTKLIKKKITKFKKIQDDIQKQIIQLKKTAKMTLVIIESPYAGDIERNVRYARECVRDSLLRGESPIASHLLYTQEGILRDEIPEEREWGINAGLAWKKVAEKHVFYIDHGYSKGMKYAKNYATENNIPVEERKIYG